MAPARGRDAAARIAYHRRVFDLFKRHRRARLRELPLTADQRATLETSVPHLARLTDADRGELGGLIQIFLAEKSFEGCGGLELTDTIKLIVAAQACLLLLHRDTDIYPGVDAILVYPHAYTATTTDRDGAVVREGEQARLGESWTRGVVVLAWDHVLSGAARPDDGKNVVLHEFAHQLDGENASMDGAPALGTRARYTAWAHVLGHEYTELADTLHAGRRSDIDAYGATSPAEFFAVVTEMFFEKPRALQRRHPELYSELAGFYRQDPAAAG